MDTPEPVMLVITEALSEGPFLRELRRALRQEGPGIILVAPAVGPPSEEEPGDVDGAIRDATQRLEVSREALAGAGISSVGEVGVSDPVAAAAEALRRYPAATILISAPAEDGVIDRARDLLGERVRLVEFDKPQPEPVESPATEAETPTEEPSLRLPRFRDGEPLAIVLAVLGAVLGIAGAVLILISLIV